MDEKPWNTNEMAEFLSKSPGAVRNLVLRKAIPYRKVGGRLYFIQQEIKDWISDSPGLRLDDLEKE